MKYLVIAVMLFTLLVPSVALADESVLGMSARYAIALMRSQGCVVVVLPSVHSSMPRRRICSVVGTGGVTYVRESLGPQAGHVYACH
jgi:hypothetical protein